MALFHERTIKVIGTQEQLVDMEEIINKFKAYSFMQSYLLPNIGNLSETDAVAVGLDLILWDLIKELEEVVNHPAQYEERDYVSFRDRVCREEKGKKVADMENARRLNLAIARNEVDALQKKEPTASDEMVEAGEEV